MIFALQGERGEKKTNKQKTRRCLGGCESECPMQAIAFVIASEFCRKLPLTRQFKSLLMPLFLMGCFPVDFQDVKRPLRTKSVKRPIQAGQRPINEGKRPIKAKVLVGVSVGSLMGCFRAPLPWRKTAPLKRPIKRSMSNSAFSRTKLSQFDSQSHSHSLANSFATLNLSDPTEIPPPPPIARQV